MAISTWLYNIEFLCRCEIRYLLMNQIRSDFWYFFIAYQFIVVYLWCFESMRGSKWCVQRRQDNQKYIQLQLQKRLCQWLLSRQLEFHKCLVHQNHLNLIKNYQIDFFELFLNLPEHVDVPCWVEIQMFPFVTYCPKTAAQAVLVITGAVP